MSLLADFGAGFFGTMGQQFGQQADDQRRLALQEALERRRRAMQLEDEERARRQKREDFVEMQNVQAEPRVGYDAEGKPSILRSTFALDDAGKLTRNDQRIGDPVMRTTGKTRKVTQGDQFVTEEEFSDGMTSEWRVKATAPRYKPGGESAARDTAGPDRRLDESNRRRDRDSLERAVNSRLTDVRNTLRGASREEDEDIGTSEYNYALEQLGLPWNTPYTEAVDMMRKRFRKELAPEYGMGEEDAPEAAKPESPSKPSKKDPNKPPVPGAIKHPNGKWYVKQADGWYEVEEEG